jgi:DNA-binding response OmpR family regulator
MARWGCSGRWTLHLVRRAAVRARTQAANQLHALDGPPPRAILLDLALPQVSGFRLLEVLRQRPALAGVPVLVPTALRFAEARGVARGGVADFLTEPFDPRAVVRRRDRLLAGAGAAPP